MGMAVLFAKRVKRVEKYLLKEDIQNEKGLDIYIDKILTEKAKNKNKDNKKFHRIISM